MPFKSKKQMKACFATNGFNGKIDCHEWAHETGDTKNLPNKVKKKKEEGGFSMLKAKMQSGGRAPITVPANDPRIRNYRDSAILYNNFVNQLNGKEAIDEKAFQDAYDRLTKLNGKIPNTGTQQTGPNSWLNKFARPVQPYYPPATKETPKALPAAANPKQQSYQDSLDLYNLSQSELKDYRNLKSKEEWYKLSDKYDNVMEPIYDRLTKYNNGKSPDFVDVNVPNTNLGEYRLPGFLPVFMNKPVGDRPSRPKVIPPRPIAKADIPGITDMTQMGDVPLPTGNLPQAGTEKTDYYINVRDESSPSKQRQIYFKDMDSFKAAMDSGEFNWLHQTIRDKSASATGYKRFQRGGRTPISVYDPNDPKLKAYKDSLRLYNTAQAAFYKQKDDEYQRELEAYNNSTDEALKKEFGKPKPPKHEGYDNPDMYLNNNNFLNAPVVNGKVPIGDVDFEFLNEGVGKNWSNKIRPVGVDLGDGYIRNALYKKPVQPVVYRPRPLAKADIPGVEDLTQIGDIPLPSANMPQAQQKKSDYYVNFRDEENPSKQSQLYFENLEQWKQFMNSGKYNMLSASENKDGSGAMATGYLRMQTGGQIDPRVPQEVLAQGAPVVPRNNNPYQTMQDVGIAMRTGRSALSWLSGLLERKRQNQFDMEQQTALGMMNPMQTADFQPNPYNLYMSRGGNLKTIMKDYNHWTNDAGPMDMTQGQGNPEMKKGGYEIDRMIIVRKLLPELLKFGKLGSSKYRNYQSGGLTRGLIPQPRYNFSPLMDRTTKQDSANYEYWFNALIQKDPTALKMFSDMRKYGTVVPDDMPLEKQKELYRYQDNKLSAFEDAFNPNVMNAQQINAELHRPLVLPKDTKKMSEGGEIEMNYRKGGIHIKKENKGKFTDYCGGKVTDECIQKGLNSSSATIRKRANFARNARKFKH